MKICLAIALAVATLLTPLISRRDPTYWIAWAEIPGDDILISANGEIYREHKIDVAQIGLETLIKRHRCPKLWTKPTDDDRLAWALELRQAQLDIIRTTPTNSDLYLGE